MTIVLDLTIFSPSFILLFPLVLLIISVAILEDSLTFGYQCCWHYSVTSPYCMLTLTMKIFFLLPVVYFIMLSTTCTVGCSLSISCGVQCAKALSNWPHTWWLTLGTLVVQSGSIGMEIEPMSANLRLC